MPSAVIFIIVSLVKVLFFTEPLATPMQVAGMLCSLVRPYPYGRGDQTRSVAGLVRQIAISDIVCDKVHLELSLRIVFAHSLRGFTE